MKVIKTIHVTGHHWGDIFDLPCILEISKMHVEDEQPHPFATLDCACCFFYEGHCQARCYDNDCDEAYPGDDIIQFDNGKWFIEKKTSCSQEPDTTSSVVKMTKVIFKTTKVIFKMTKVNLSVNINP